ncbi:hypothetical protein [Streptomyces avicenniae]|uniref:hypothetical protein n=1 Tax=Streptomyces avicenniae TaxID=500153 RepID=UPI00069B6FC8|nr:hypothetical protein [Streptomyces avicenniae]
MTAPSPIAQAAAALPHTPAGPERDALLTTLHRALRTAPDPPHPLRDTVLRACTPAELRDWGPYGAHELARRTGEPPCMTPDFLHAPTPPQSLLSAGPPLDDEVFAAAVRLLPDAPAALRDGEDLGSWVSRHRAALNAWQTMWRDVLLTHPDRHRAVVTLTTGTPAGNVVRDLLLGTLPWAVAPDLLTELADDDLSRFDGALLAARICRLLCAGRTPQDVRAEVAGELDALPPDVRAFPEAWFGTLGAAPERGVNAAAEWAERAATGRWRALLDPTTAGERTWRAAPADVQALAERFAAVAAHALDTWRPAPGRADRPRPDWLRDLPPSEAGGGVGTAPVPG